MNMYQSTRNSAISLSSAQAITQGISVDGGLFVPKEFPQISHEFLSEMTQKNYRERAKAILSLFLTDFSAQQLEICVNSAYTQEKFDSENCCDIVPISHLFDGRYMLELWHGPTCAFKDMALQLLPHLMKTSAQITQNEKELVILVATSGDTGKAALEGFKDVEKTKIIVFYPRDGVSHMQKLQMISQLGKNVKVCAIEGNFDDAQTAVKSIFADKELGIKLLQKNMQFSSANSINWGRLVPQIVYYISAYADLVLNEEIKIGEEINVCVPTGNFGNILAAYYAKKMGIPFDKLICASNENNVLTDFINTGIYDKNRDFHETSSPSMDILVSSNLERLLYDLSDKDDISVANWLNQLNQTGRYEVSDKVKAGIHNNFACGYANKEKTNATIKDVFSKYSYLLDPHTAVAVSVYEEYKKASNDDKKVLIASTANPYKFTKSVLSAIKTPKSEDEFEQIEELCELSGLAVPQALAGLAEADVRFNDTVKKEDIQKYVITELSL